MISFHIARVFSCLFTTGFGPGRGGSVYTQKLKTVNFCTFFSCELPSVSRTPGFQSLIALEFLTIQRYISSRYVVTYPDRGISTSVNFSCPGGMSLIYINPASRSKLLLATQLVLLIYEKEVKIKLFFNRQFIQATKDHLVFLACSYINTLN